MSRCLWICAAVALLATAACHKKPDVESDSQVVFTNSYAAGSKGDEMSRMATKYEIPIYPGATFDVSHFNPASTNDGRVYLAYTTPDTTDKVISFFKGNMQLGASTSGAVTVLTGTTHNGSPVTINVGQKMDGSGTSFSIVVAPQAVQGYDNTPVANTAPTTPQPMAAQPTPQTPVPPPTNYSQKPEAPSVYVPTSNSPDDGNNSDDGSQDQQSNDQGTTNTTGGDTGVSQSDSGPPGG